MGGRERPGRLSVPVPPSGRGRTVRQCLSLPSRWSGEVRVRQAVVGIDPVEQRSPPVIPLHPGPVGLGDLVVHSGEGAVARPVREGAGLPGEPFP